MSTFRRERKKWNQIVLHFFGVYGAMQDFFLPLTPEISDSLRKNTSMYKNGESAFHLNAILKIP